jgi:hypothetical protein
MADKVEANTFGLPTGEPIRRELARRFRAQRDRTLADLGITRVTPVSKGSRRGDLTVRVQAPKTPPHIECKDLGPGFSWDVPDYQADTSEWAEAMAPLIEALWDDAGADVLTRIGLDPDDWSVTNPEVAAAIRAQAFDFCEATNATTRLEVSAAYEGLRDRLHQGLIDEPAATEGLVGLVREVFLDAATWRARRIATTEASRAVHAAELLAARRSGIVLGLRWLLSSDACSLCHRIADEVGAVRLGEPFATTGDHPSYGVVRHPPAHPHCQCTTVNVVMTAYSGEPEPRWGEPIDVRPAAPAFTFA